MKYSFLGKTGLNVSMFCMGSLVMGPAQYNLSMEQSQTLIRDALAAGVNFSTPANSTECTLSCVACVKSKTL